ncbi:MAG: TetR/AcrR family transcriptional regulator [Mycetocola sp.]
MSATAPRVRAPRRDAAHNREHLISTAIDCLRDNPTASLDDIARAAGLSRRSVYSHFSGREELMRVVIGRGARRIGEHVGTVDNSDAPLALAILASRLWDQIAHIRANAALALQAPYRADVAAALEPLRTQLRETISVGIRRGQLPDGIPAATVAVLVEGAAVGVFNASAADLISTEESRDLIILSGLGAAGLSRADATAALDRFAAQADTPTTAPPTDAPSETMQGAVK